MVDRTVLRELLTSEPAAFAAGAAEYVGSVEPYESFDPDAVPVPTDELLDRERTNFSICVYHRRTNIMSMYQWPPRK